MTDVGENEPENSSSMCLMLSADDAGGTVKEVKFNRDEKEGGDIDAAAAHLLGIDGERVRCFYVPHCDKKLGYAVHMYIDLTGAEHGKAHNTNASQFWLAANLPAEPPELSPSSINGPALVTAELIPSEDYKDLSTADWEAMKAFCRELCPSATFFSD